MDKVGEIRGRAVVAVGWYRFADVGYRLDVLETAGRRRLSGGELDFDEKLLSAVGEYGEAVIELPGALGAFTFVVTDAVRNAIRISGPVTRAETARDWREADP